MFYISAINTTYWEFLGHLNPSVYMHLLSLVSVRWALIVVRRASFVVRRASFVVCRASYVMCCASSIVRCLKSVKFISKFFKSFSILPSYSTYFSYIKLRNIRNAVVCMGNKLFLLTSHYFSNLTTQNWYEFNCNQISCSTLGTPFAWLLLGIKRAFLKWCEEREKGVVLIRNLLVILCNFAYENEFLTIVFASLL